MKMNMKERLVAVFVFVMVIVMPARGHLGAVGHVQPASGAGESPDTHRALISRYCVTCHNESTRTAGLALDSLDLSQVGPHASTWEKVVRKLRGGVMPPVHEAARGPPGWPRRGAEHERAPCRDVALAGAES